MLTNWLIWLDLLEENNQNTIFLRLVTPIIFSIIECHHYIYADGFGDGNSDGFGSGYGFVNDSGSGYIYISGNGNGFGYGYGYGNGNGFGYDYSNIYNEDH